MFPSLLEGGCVTLAQPETLDFLTPEGGTYFSLEVDTAAGPLSSATWGPGGRWFVYGTDGGVVHAIDVEATRALLAKEGFGW